MNFLTDLILAFVLASGISFALTILSSLAMSLIVNGLSLNQNQDAYWALYVAFWVGTISWIVSFGYFMRKF